VNISTENNSAYINPVISHRETQTWDELSTKRMKLQKMEPSFMMYIQEC
jgi:hypothetical protein